MMATRAPVGWPLLPRPDAFGRIAFPNPEQSVRELIQVLLLTKPGEQLMRPHFGAGLEDFVFQPNTVATRRRVRDTVREALAHGEPRVLLDRVDVWDVPDEPTHVRVEIAYRIRRTGSAHELGLTMALEG